MQSGKNQDITAQDMEEATLDILSKITSAVGILHTTKKTKTIC